MFDRFFFEALAEKGRESLPPRPGDYIGDDGFLHCGNCGEAREKNQKFDSGSLKVPILCRCDRERRDAEEAAEKLAKRQIFAREHAFDSATTPKRQKTFDRSRLTGSNIMTVAKEYANSFESGQSEGLLFYGCPGHGKTHAALCILNALVDRGIPARFVSVPSWVIKPFADSSAALEELSRFDLVVLDDLGAERQTETAAASVFTLVDTLYENQTAMIVTSNLTPAQIADAEGNRRRVFDRLLERCRLVSADGPDIRRQLTIALNGGAAL